MARSYKKHVKLYYGFFGDPIKKHKHSGKIDVKCGTTCATVIEDNVDDDMVSCNHGVYKKQQGQRYYEVGCYINMTLPKARHYRRIPVSSEKRRKVEQEISWIYLVCK